MPGLHRKLLREKWENQKNLKEGISKEATNPETACPQTDRRPPAHTQPSEASAQDKDTQPRVLPPIPIFTPK